MTADERTNAIAHLKKMLRRAKRVKAEAEQYCRDIAYWNAHVRNKEQEAPLFVERDMEMLEPAMESLIKQIDGHLAEFDVNPLTGR